MPAQVGETLGMVALFWFLYDASASALKMVMLGVFQTLPALLLVGRAREALVRIRRSRLWTAGAAGARSLALAAVPALYASDLLRLRWLYLLVLISSALALLGPSAWTRRPTRAGESDVLARNAPGLGLLIGPVFAGIGIEAVGALNLLVVQAALVGTGAVVFLRSGEGPRPPAAESRRGRLRDAGFLTGGFRVLVLEHRETSALLAAVAFYGAAAACLPFMLPVLAQHRFGSPIAMGWVWSGLGAGSLMASAWLAGQRLDDRSMQVGWGAGLAVAAGTSVCVLAVSAGTISAALLLTVAGGAVALFTPVAWDEVRRTVPHAVAPCATDALNAWAMIASLAGLLAFGFATDVIGPDAGVLLAGLLLLGAGAMTAIYAAARSPARNAPATPS